MKQPTTDNWLSDLRAELADHQQQLAEGKTCDGYEWMTKRRLVNLVDILVKAQEANEAMRSGFKRLSAERNT